MTTKWKGLCFSNNNDVNRGNPRILHPKSIRSENDVEKLVELDKTARLIVTNGILRNLEILLKTTNPKKTVFLMN